MHPRTERGLDPSVERAWRWHRPGHGTCERNESQAVEGDTAAHLAVVPLQQLYYSILQHDFFVEVRTCLRLESIESRNKSPVLCRSI